MNSSNESKTDAFHLHKFFSSKVDLADALPPAVGNKFESAEVADPTFGGLLPYWTNETLKAKMQKNDLLANDSIEGAKAIPGSSNWKLAETLRSELAVTAMGFSVPFASPVQLEKECPAAGVAYR